MRMDLINVKVKPEHIEVVARAIGGEEETAQGFQFMFESLGIDSEGVLSLVGEPVGKWSEEEMLAEWLGEYCSCGFLAFWSEEGDGAAWAYEFDGVGGMNLCSARRAAAIKGILARRARQTAEIGKKSTRKMKTYKE